MPEKREEEILRDDECCPHCGSEERMSDYFENTWTYWCGFCGKELYYEDESGSYSSLPPTEGELTEIEIPGHTPAEA